MTPSGFYRPLDAQSQQIRLLRILPSTEFEAPLHCSISVASLRADPPPIYQALSYVWGDPGQNAEINIEGTDRPTTIGLNLSLAIRYIRHNSDVVVLWADALCINQEDPQERMHQVRTMGLVYSGAKEVIAWLGEENKDTKIAMELLESWAKLINMSNSFKAMRGVPSGPAIKEQLDKVLNAAPNSRANLALLALAKNPYWTRVWICQELSLGKNVVFQCGRSSTTLFFLVEVLEAVSAVFLKFVPSLGTTTLLPILKLQSSNMFHMLEMVQRLRGMKWESLPLSHLNKLRRMRSTDPRDKVFALLGFVALDGPFPELIAPDYEKSTEQVYLDVARYLILTEQTLDVLNMRHLRLSTGRPPSMPTWVPNWQLMGRYRHFDYDDSGKERALKKSKIVSRLVTFLPDGKLSAKGFALDVISEVFNPGLLPFRSTLEYPNPAFKDFVKCIVTGPLVRGETTLSALVRLMDPKHRDQSDDSYIEKATGFLWFIYMTTRRRECFLADVTPLSLVTAFLGVEAAQSKKERLESLVLGRDLNSGSNYDWYHTRYCTMLDGCWIFRTEGGSLGLGSEGLAKDDVICHLAAHPKPFLLRPAGPNYINVEDCEVLDLDLPEVKEEMIPDMREFVIE